MMDRSTTCCFTGHRDIPETEKPMLFARVKQTVEQLYDKGYRSFLCGGAVGFDQLAADAVILLRQTLDIKLYLVIPCEDQDKYFTKEHREIYRRTRELADGVHVLYPSYVRGCMHTRNRKMVISSSVCITYVRKPTGGSAYTRDYANKNELHIIDL